MKHLLKIFDFVMNQHIVVANPRAILSQKRRHIPFTNLYWSYLY